MGGGKPAVALRDQAASVRLADAALDFTLSPRSPRHSLRIGFSTAGHHCGRALDLRIRLPCREVEELPNGASGSVRDAVHGDFERPTIGRWSRHSRRTVPTKHASCGRRPIGLQPFEASRWRPSLLTESTPGRGPSTHGPQNCSACRRSPALGRRSRACRGTRRSVGSTLPRGWRSGAACSTNVDVASHATR